MSLIIATREFWGSQLIPCPISAGLFRDAANFGRRASTKINARTRTVRITTGFILLPVRNTP
jgi:hypothetical protein